MAKETALPRDAKHGLVPPEKARNERRVVIGDDWFAKRLQTLGHYPCAEFSDSLPFALRACPPREAIDGNALSRPFFERHRGG